MKVRVKIITLLFICVSLLMTGWGQAEPVVKGAVQIQPYVTENGMCNTVQPSCQEYYPSDFNVSLGIRNVVHQDEGNRVPSQKVQQYPGKDAGVAAAEATTR